MSDKIITYPYGSYVSFSLIFDHISKTEKLCCKNLDTWSSNVFVFVKNPLYTGSAQLVPKQGIYDAKINHTSFSFVPFSQFSRFNRIIFDNSGLPKVSFNKRFPTLSKLINIVTNIVSDFKSTTTKIDLNKESNVKKSTVTQEQCLTKQKGGIVLAVFKNGKMVFGSTPKVHNEHTWKAEAERVASTSGLKVVALRVEGTVTSGKVVWD